MTYKFKVLSIKTSTTLFKEYDQLILKSVQINKGLRIVKTALKKGDRTWETYLPDIKTYKARIIKPEW